jgi:hypothetical protein
VITSIVRLSICNVLSPTLSVRVGEEHRFDSLVEAVS